jgi:hypothetical protein
MCYGIVFRLFAVYFLKLLKYNKGGNATAKERVFGVETRSLAVAFLPLC